MTPNWLLGQHYIKTRPVLIWDKKTITQQQFAQAILQQAAYIQQADAERWALSYKDSYQFIITLAAVWLAGKQPVILPNQQAGTLAELKHEYDEIVSDISGLNSTIQSLSETVVIAEIPRQPLVIFTSGSNGKPKKVLRSLAALMQEIIVLEQCFGKKMADATIYSSVSHQHIYGLLFYLLWPLYAGRSIAGPSLHYPEELAALVEQSEPMVLISSPTLLSRLEKNLAFPKSALVFTSGGLLKQAVAEQLAEQHGWQPIEILGSTETGGVAYRQQILQPLWQTLPQVNINIHQTQGLQVCSPFFDGDEPFLMGDQIIIHSTGLFQLGDRADRIVKIEGKRLSLTDMEQKIMQQAWIAEAKVIRVEMHRELIAAVLVLNEEGKVLLETLGKRKLDQLLQSALKIHFEAVLCPKKIRYVETLPINSQGKITQQALLALFMSGAPVKKPELLTVEQEEKSVKLKLRFPQQLIYFQGHFEQQPILPGVAQIYLAVAYAQQYLNIERPQLDGVKQVKFLQLIQPNAELDLLLQLTEQELHFCYQNADQTYAAGKIKLRQE